MPPLVLVIVVAGRAAVCSLSDALLRRPPSLLTPLLPWVAAALLLRCGCLLSGGCSSAARWAGFSGCHAFLVAAVPPRVSPGGLPSCCCFFLFVPAAVFLSGGLSPPPPLLACVSAGRAAVCSLSAAAPCCSPTAAAPCCSPFAAVPCCSPLPQLRAAVLLLLLRAANFCCSGVQSFCYRSALQSCCCSVHQTSCHNSVQQFSAAAPCCSSLLLLRASVLLLRAVASNRYPVWTRM